MTQLQQHSWNLIHGTPDDADDETVETTDDGTKEDLAEMLNCDVFGEDDEMSEPVTENVDSETEDVPNDDSAGTYDELDVGIGCVDDLAETVPDDETAGTNWPEATEETSDVGAVGPEDGTEAEE
ncbi:unnamed protein product [Ambrosiozyma monospora]|uniref:Unnamed protein product n=1 Tax=Ambrosiozyma monospora TaxID=43982 RepID=A0ACB5TVA8_AMBMO|nr:unnamed protein product [Ambrosiozyma monospora]